MNVKTTDDKLNETRRFFSEAADEYSREKFDAPKPLDLSFLSANQKVEPRKQKRRIVMKRWVAIAATVAVILGGVTVFQMSTSQNQAYADWGILHRLIERIAGGITTDEDDALEEVVSKLTITNEAKLDEGKKEFTNLFIPNYITQGFYFKSLEIERFGTGSVTAKYVYAKEESTDYYNIEQTYMPSGTIKYESHNSGETIKMDDRIIRLIQSGDSVEVYTEKGIVVIYGTILQTEMLEIAKGLN